MVGLDSLDRDVADFPTIKVAEVKLDFSQVDPVILYVLARTDMASMSPGRVAAQACHAANQCVKELTRIQFCAAPPDGVRLYDGLLDEWEAQTGNGFGTTIVLDVGSGEDLVRVVDSRPFNDVHGGLVCDPTYPVHDGSVVHLVWITTCGFIFGRESVAGNVVAGLPLYTGS